jgi:5-methylthioadenosine/S-adenosylhomocysteine deaminase
LRALDASPGKPSLASPQFYHAALSRQTPPERFPRDAAWHFTTPRSAAAGCRRGAPRTRAVARARRICDDSRPIMETVDTLIQARWVVPVEPRGAVLADHAVALRDGRIVALLPREEAARRFDARETVRHPDAVLIPGLVNAHTHAAMTLLRGYADDLPLMTWLSEHIWPAEAKHVSAEFVRDGTRLAAAEMLRGGVTCMNDMYFFPEAAAEAALALGMRATLGMIAIEFPTAYASDADDYLARGLALRDARRHEPLLSFCLAPHAPYTVGDKTFEKIARYAAELGVPVHVHLHETLGEIEQSMKDHGVRPLQRLHRLGLIGPQTIAVHAVHLDDAEIDLLAREGASVAHCPASNLKLASGLAPIARLLDAGVNLAIGTDGAASNNRLDMIAEMRLAALLAKGASGRADVLPAAAALRAATLGGATALGLEKNIGSIEPGKAADLAAVWLGRADLQPVFDPVSHLVYAAERSDVAQVWVAGRSVALKQRLSHAQDGDLESLAGLWQNRMRVEG